MSPPTNQHPAFYRPDVLPVAQPTVSGQTYVYLPSRKASPPIGWYQIILRAKLQSNSHHQQTNTQLFTGWMPFLSPNQQYQSEIFYNKIELSHIKCVFVRNILPICRRYCCFEFLCVVVIKNLCDCELRVVATFTSATVAVNHQLQMLSVSSGELYRLGMHR